MKKDINLKIKELREKHKYSQEEISRKGWEIYRKIKRELEKKYMGQFILIEPESGNYYIGDDDLTLAIKARSKYPESIFYFKRIGYKASHKLKRNKINDNW